MNYTINNIELNCENFYNQVPQDEIKGITHYFCDDLEHNAVSIKNYKHKLMTLRSHYKCIYSAAEQEEFALCKAMKLALDNAVTKAILLDEKISKNTYNISHALNLTCDAISSMDSLKGVFKIASKSINANFENDHTFVTVFLLVALATPMTTYLLLPTIHWTIASIFSAIVATPLIWSYDVALNDHSANIELVTSGYQHNEWFLKHLGNGLETFREAAASVETSELKAISVYENGDNNSDHH